jgi:excisionase family DNA binding protein
MKIPPAKKLIDVPTLAKRKSIAPKTLYKWISLNKVPYYKLSPKCVRFDEAEIDEWLEARRVKARS